MHGIGEILPHNPESVFAVIFLICLSIENYLVIVFIHNYLWLLGSFHLWLLRILETVKFFSWWYTWLRIFLTWDVALFNWQTWSEICSHYWNLLHFSVRYTTFMIFPPPIEDSQYVSPHCSILKALFFPLELILTLSLPQSPCTYWPYTFTVLCCVAYTITNYFIYFSVESTVFFDY